MSQENIFPFPGSKGRFKDWVIDNIPKHDCYVEPFGGSAAVLLEKEPSKVEVYNDADSLVSTFFKVLRTRPDELIEWLTATPYCRRTHDEFNARLYGDGDPPDSEIATAGMFFSLRYSSFGGKQSDAFKRPRPDENSGGWRDFASSFKNAKRDLSTFAQRLEGVTVENEDYTKILESYDSPTTFFYCDPPYRGAESYYSGEFSHRELVEILDGLEGKWALSCLKVPDEFAEYHIAKADGYHAIGGRESVDEVLVMNFDPDETASFAGVSHSQQKLTTTQYND